MLSSQRWRLATPVGSNYAVEIGDFRTGRMHQPNAKILECSALAHVVCRVHVAAHAFDHHRWPSASRVHDIGEPERAVRRGEVWTAAGGPRSKLGDRIGRLDDDDMLRLGRAVLVFIGLAGD